MNPNLNVDMFLQIVRCMGLIIEGMTHPYKSEVIDSHGNMGPSTALKVPIMVFES